MIRNLADDGNELIFTTSFGYMNPTIKVAKRYPDVKFEHATGYQRADNVATYNARFYEGRAVCGTIAGHMSKTGVAGYIASFPIPEVVMGINAFTLAARKVNPEFKTNVVWVSSWYDPAKEADAAKALFDQGADIIAQHTDSPAALQAAEQRGLMAFGQAWNMSTFAPKAHLTAIENHWGVYYVDRIRKMLDGTWESADTWWGFKEGILQMSPFNEAMPEEAVAAANATQAGIVDGSAPVFAGPIKDRDGAERVAAGATLDDAGLLRWTGTSRACRADQRRRRRGRAAPALTALASCLMPQASAVDSTAADLSRVAGATRRGHGRYRMARARVLRGRVLRFLAEPAGHRRHGVLRLRRGRRDPGPRRPGRRRRPGGGGAGAGRPAARGGRPPAAPADAGLHRHPHPHAAGAGHRLLGRAAARLAEHLHLPRGGEVRRPGARRAHRRRASSTSCSRHGTTTAVAYCSVAPDLGRRLLRRGRGPRPAHDRRQGDDGPQRPRRRPRHRRSPPTTTARR